MLKKICNAIKEFMLGHLNAIYFLTFIVSLSMSILCLLNQNVNLWYYNIVYDVFIALATSLIVYFVIDIANKSKESENDKKKLKIILLKYEKPIRRFNSLFIRIYRGTSEKEISDKDVFLDNIFFNVDELCNVIYQYIKIDKDSYEAKKLNEMEKWSQIWFKYFQEIEANFKECVNNYSFLLPNELIDKIQNFINDLYPAVKLHNTILELLNAIPDKTISKSGIYYDLLNINRIITDYAELLNEINKTIGKDYRKIKYEEINQSNVHPFWGELRN